MDLGINYKQVMDSIFKEWKLMMLLGFICLIYSYYTSTFDHFNKIGIKYMKPIIFFGSYWSLLVSKKSYCELQTDMYRFFKGDRIGGFFEGRRPTLVILDPDLIKSITIKDFDHFVDRDCLNTNEPKHLKKLLINLKGSEWKAVRCLLSPTFSSSRIKNMLPIMQESSEKLISYLENIDGSNVEIKKIMGYYTLDVIGACAFGIDTQVLSDENSVFVKAAENFKTIPFIKLITMMFLLIIVPDTKYLNVSFVNHNSVCILLDILQKAKAERKLSKTKRNDFLQLLVDAINEQTEARELDEDTIDAQALFFLLAGYETSSTLLSFAIYTLATHPDIQETLWTHIQQVTKGRELSYERLSELEYLEGFLLETLRLYPPVLKIGRECVKPYTLPGTSITVEANQKILIPIYAIHMDADIYPEPEKFRPERFMKEEKKERAGHLFLAFGSGPRNCIGLRFAMVSVKLAMVALLRKYKFLTCPKTEIPLKTKKSTILDTQNGIWVKVEKI